MTARTCGSSAPMTRRPTACSRPGPARGPAPAGGRPARPATSPEAEVDLRVGRRYRLAIATPRATESRGQRRHGGRPAGAAPYTWAWRSRSTREPRHRRVPRRRRGDDRGHHPRRPAQRRGARAARPRVGTAASTTSAAASRPDARRRHRRAADRGAPRGGRGVRDGPAQRTASLDRARCPKSASSTTGPSAPARASQRLAHFLGRGIEVREPDHRVEPGRRLAMRSVRPFPLQVTYVRGRRGYARRIRTGGETGRYYAFAGPLLERAGQARRRAGPQSAEASCWNRAMDTDALRTLQAPLKQRYRDDPDAAIVTLKASGSLGEGISCSVDTGRALAEAGLHPASGGDGSQLCSATCCSRRSPPAPA